MNNRYGKRVRIEFKATIKENGTTKQLFFCFPKSGFDRPTNVFYFMVGWFRSMFSEITEWEILRALKKTNTLLAEKIMDYFVEKIESGKAEEEIEHACFK